MPRKVEIGELCNNYKLVEKTDEYSKTHRLYLFQCQSCNRIRKATMQAIKTKHACIECARKKYSVGQVFHNRKIISKTSDKGDAVYTVQCVTCEAIKEISRNTLLTGGCQNCHKFFPGYSTAVLGKRFGLVKEAMRIILVRNPEITLEYLLNVDPLIFKARYQRKKNALPRCILDDIRNRNSATIKQSRYLYIKHRQKVKSALQTELNYKNT